MARGVTVCFLLVVFVGLVSSQGFDFFGGYNSLVASSRDPRANQGNAGPVVFPMTSPGSETSGVRVGASGYGFVPPGFRGGIGPHGAGPNYFRGFYW